MEKTFRNYENSNSMYHICSKANSPEAAIIFVSWRRVSILGAVQAGPKASRLIKQKRKCSHKNCANAKGFLNLF